MQLIFTEGTQHDARIVALVRQSSHAVCIFADRPLERFSLVNAEEFAVPRGMHCVGAVGFVDGAPRAALTEDLDETTLTALTTACVAQLVTILERCAGFSPIPVRSDA